jgi:hypothetical protein
MAVTNTRWYTKEATTKTHSKYSLKCKIKQKPNAALNGLNIYHEVCITPE